MRYRPPFRFHTAIYGLPHVLVDADGQVLVSHLPADVGPVLAAAPSMLAVLRRVADRLPEADPLGALARKAIAAAEPPPG